jgi:hypothetical protein
LWSGSDLEDDPVEIAAFTAELNSVEELALA